MYKFHLYQNEWTMDGYRDDNSSLLVPSTQPIPTWKGALRHCSKKLLFYSSRFLINWFQLLNFYFIFGR